jgi:hypothetical protein
MRRPKSTLGIFFGFTLFLPACANEPGSVGAESTTTKRSAVTASAVPPNVAHREDDFGPPRRSVTLGPPGAVAPVPPPPAALPAAQYLGHVRNKTVDKPPPERIGAPPPPVPAEYIAKQKEYAKRLGDLGPTIVNLPPEEQKARRAALKRSVLGD